MRFHSFPRQIIYFGLIALAFYIAAPSWAATNKIQGDVIGQLSHYQVQQGDTLNAIARKFDLGFVELLAANPGLTAKTLKPGMQLVLPTMHVLPPGNRDGIVVNLSELRLYYFADDNTVMTFPIGIGREGWETPVTETEVTNKRKNPSWRPPDSIRAEKPDLPEVVPPGPNNPLGQHALSLGKPGYLIHGTNNPNSIGKRASHGCIRMYPEDIAALFEVVEEGTPVYIIDTPYKVGWSGRHLLLEITPTQEQSDDIAKYRQPKALDISEAYEAVTMAAEGRNINWPLVEQAAASHSGVPVVIATKLLPWP